ncbi:MAG: hypothetical protein R2748_18990 [Bryobacterales bacterium]
MPFLVVGTTLVAQAPAGNATLGNTGLTYGGGFWSGMALPLGGVSLFVVGRFLAAPLNSMDLITLPEFFYRRYGKKTGRWSRSSPSAQVLHPARGQLGRHGLDPLDCRGLVHPVALIAGTTVLFAYTIAGALYAAIWTDFVRSTWHRRLLPARRLALSPTSGRTGKAAPSPALPPAHVDFSGLTSLPEAACSTGQLSRSLSVNAVALDFMAGACLLGKNPARRRATLATTPAC